MLLIFVFVPGILAPLLLLLPIRSRRQLPPLGGIFHERLIRCLLLSLNRQQRVLANLIRRIANRIRVLHRHKCLLRGLLRQLLIIGPLQQRIDAAFAEQISLHLLSCAIHSLRWATV